jgi:hypothetical protein
VRGFSPRNERCSTATSASERTKKSPIYCTGNPKSWQRLCLRKKMGIRFIYSMIGFLSANKTEALDDTIPAMKNQVKEVS